MTDYAIRVDRLSKRFLKEDSTVSLLSRLVRSRSGASHFWALRDITFDVERGDSLGIIGGNGAGKSTLLKIISRILAPTQGRIELYGTVNSLLEVGTGFEPNLSGRQNIYLNASILGMSREQTRAVFDEIVDFSGLRDFIDMPVKYYSSGMYARLAFSVAANVTGDVLALDEVLSVGDAEFRKKCLARMGELITSNRTILFVSHSMDAITRFCSKAIWLERGRLRAMGPATDVVRDYLGSVSKLSATYSGRSGEEAAKANGAPPPADPVKSAEGNPHRETNGAAEGLLAEFSAPARLNAEDRPSSVAEIVRVTAGSSTGDAKTVLFRDEDVVITVEFEVLKDKSPPLSCYISVRCNPRKGVHKTMPVFSSFSDSRIMAPGRYTMAVTIPKHLLISAVYTVTVGVASVGKPVIAHHTLKKVVSFQVVDNDEDSEVLGEHLRGVIRPHLSWQLDGLVAPPVGTAQTGPAELV